MKNRDYTDYINDILNSIEEAIEFTGSMTLMNFPGTKRQLMR